MRSSKSKSKKSSSKIQQNLLQNRQGNDKIEIINKLTNLFSKCSEDNLSMGDSGQTLQQFLSMKGVEPNEEGSGRYSFTDIKKIECLYFSKAGAKKHQKISNRERSKIQQLLTLYTNIPVQLSESILQINNSSLSDWKRGLEYTLKINKSRFNAMQLLDLLVEYKSESNLLIGFIEHGLHENGEDVYGRACGNGVAIIDLQVLREGQQQKERFYQTVIHQTLHTLGFDHCLAYKCLMNPCIANNMWLCSVCLNKLHSEIKVELKEWVQNLSNFFKNQLRENKLLHQKSLKILETITIQQIKKQAVIEIDRQQNK